MSEEIFLLGAGASFDAGLPLASTLFDLLIKDLKNQKWINIIEKLKSLSNDQFEDAISTLDFLNLQNFSSLELDFLKYLSSDKLTISKDFLVDVYNLVDHIKRIWINTRFKITDKKQVEYLYPFVDYCSQNNSEIFTLNYDNTLESACDFCNIKYNTGFGNQNEFGTKFFASDIFSKNKDLKIYKLHGSVGWFISKSSPDNLYNNVYEPEKYNENDFEEKMCKPAIILGSRNKLTSEGMYLDLLQIFRNKLNEAKNIYIIGYKFLDSHINKYIQETWVKNSNIKISIVEPYPPDLNRLPSPSFLGGAFEVKGSFDFRNLFGATGNPQNNNLIGVHCTFKEFSNALIGNQKLEGIDYTPLFKSNNS